MNLEKDEINFLRNKAWELRKEVIDMVFNCETSSGHLGGSLSAAEIISVLYWKILRLDIKNPKWEYRDRFIISKGHSAPILYAALANKGFFSRDILKTYRRDGSILQGHPDSTKTPGVDASSGSLGQGLSVALGMALSARNTNKDFNVYCLLGDGEMDSGLIWEAAMAASHYKVANLTAIIDYNHMQVDGDPKDIMNIEPLAEKWRAFGWEVLEVDGHDVEFIYRALEIRKMYKNTPFVIIGNTVKGKGVSYMENSIKWHACKITEEQKDKAIEEINALCSPVECLKKD